MVHWCVVMKFWYVCTQKSGVRCWYGSVDESLYIVISAVGVVTSPGYSIIIPQTVSLVLWVSSLCGLMSQNIITYIPFQFCGTCNFGMKKIIFDPTTLLPTPWKSMSNSLEKYLCQIIFSSPLPNLYLLLKIQYQYGWKH